MKKKKLFIHVGYPKTATTTLQKHLFSRHDELWRADNHELSFFRSLYFGRENHIKRMKADIDEEIQRLWPTDKKIVLSSESFTSFAMFFRFSPSPYIWTVEPNSVARKLHTAFGQSDIIQAPKVIIAIRRQIDLLKSIYAQVYNLVYKKYRETKTFRRFLDYAIYNNDGFIIDALHFNDVIRQYETLFGKRNVCVLVFEMLQQNPRRYIRTLSDFMGIDNRQAFKLLSGRRENKKSNTDFYESDRRDLFQTLASLKRKIFKGQKFGLSRGGLRQKLTGFTLPGKRLRHLEIPDDETKLLRNLFTAGNKDLSERYQLGLAKYDYYD